MAVCTVTYTNKKLGVCLKKKKFRVDKFYRPSPHSIPFFPSLSTPAAVQRSQYLRMRADEVAFFERLYSLGDPQVRAHSLLLQDAVFLLQQLAAFL